MRRLSDDRGGILVVSALIIPVFLLFVALALDVGNWYTHKRALQNRADAGALAAGVEYLAQFGNCRTDPSGAGDAIADAARLYAGPYNQAVTGPVSVDVNADGINPCEPHPPDEISPTGGIWTDVKVREDDVGTLAGSFGLSLASITAQARVQLKQIVAVGGALPFVTETGDEIDCVWAQFVRATDGSTAAGFAVTPSEPVRLTGGPPTWTGTVENLEFTNAQDDVAIRYWAGTASADGGCTFSSETTSPLPHDTDTGVNPVSTTRLNVYSTAGVPGTGDPPLLRKFSLSSGNCGGPGFLAPPSDDPALECRVGFEVIVDTGVNDVEGEITIEPVGTAVTSVTVPYMSAGEEATVGGTLPIRPNETASGSPYSQDYTQIGQTFFKVSWKTTTINNEPCGPPLTCSGTFEGEPAGGAEDVQQAIYTADPLGSPPMTAASTSLTSTSFPAGGSTGEFTVSLTHGAFDDRRTVLVRSGGVTSGNRVASVVCRTSAGPRGTCRDPLVVNQRSSSCEPPSSDGTFDCVDLVAQATVGPFECTPNNWQGRIALPSDSDPRWAFLPLTGFGRTYRRTGGSVPVEGFVRIYVTGSDGLALCSENDDPPRGHRAGTSQLWGHLVSPITLDPNVVSTSDENCDVDRLNVQCKPTLVR